MELSGKLFPPNRIHVFPLASSGELAGWRNHIRQSRVYAGSSARAGCPRQPMPDGEPATRITSQCCGRPRVASKACPWYSVPRRVALSATDCHPLCSRGALPPETLDYSRPSPRRRFTPRMIRVFVSTALIVAAVDATILLTLGATSDTATAVWQIVNLPSLPCVFGCVMLVHPPMGESEMIHHGITESLPSVLFSHA